MSKAEQTGKESQPMTSHTELVSDVIKRFGVVSVAKSIVDENRNYGITEQEFVELASESAQAEFPLLSKAQAFAKLYENPMIWRACNVLKSMPFVADVVPVMVGGEAAQAVNDPTEAIAQLKQLGARKWPTASEADQFERALCDPVNHKLARLAVPIPQPTTQYPFPR